MCVQYRKDFYFMMQGGKKMITKRLFMTRISTSLLVRAVEKLCLHVAKVVSWRARSKKWQFAAVLPPEKSGQAVVKSYYF